MSQDYYCNIQMFIYLLIPRIKDYKIILAVVSEHFYFCFMCYTYSYVAISQDYQLYIMLMLKATHNQDCYLATKIAMVNDLTEAVWL